MATWMVCFSTGNFQDTLATQLPDRESAWALLLADLAVIRHLLDSVELDEAAGTARSRHSQSGEPYEAWIEEEETKEGLK